MKFRTAEYYYDNFRILMGDGGGDITEEFFLSCINYMIRDIMLEAKLERLFRVHDTMRLTQLTRKGKKSNKWKISLKNLGDIIDIHNLVILEADGCTLCPVQPCYMEPDKFYNAFPFPEGTCPGQPCHYTIDEDGENTYLMFDKPVDKPYIVDLRYSAYPGDIESLEDKVPYPVKAINVLIEGLRREVYQRDTDFAFSRSMFDVTDLNMARIKNMLYKVYSVAAPRRIDGMR